MTQIISKFLITLVIYIFASLSVYAQQHRVHKTERTIRFTADNVSVEFNISNCVGGVFIARESSNNISYIIDTLCHTLGKINLETGSFYPNFYGGEVATAILSNGNPAIINTKGEIVQQFPEGRNISSHFVDGVALLKVTNPKTYESIVVYIDEQGEHIYKHLTMKERWGRLSCDVSPLRDGRRRYYDSEKGLYGYIDENGKIVIPAKFKAAHDFSDGLAAFTSNEGSVKYWGFIDKSGNEIIRPVFRYEPGDFHDGFALVKKQNGKYVFIDKETNIRTQELDKATRFFQGYALIKAYDLYGADCYVVDKNFKRIRTIDSFYPNQIKYNDYNNTFIMEGVVFNPDGVMKLNPTRHGRLIRNFIEDIALYHCNDFTGFINSKGEVLMYFVQSEF